MADVVNSWFANRVYLPALLNAQIGNVANPKVPSNYLGITARLKVGKRLSHMCMYS
jgi:hypothetical protein